MALLLNDVVVEHREISLKNRPKELYSISPKGTVPVLHLSDNIVIDESHDIMLWAFKNNSSDFIPEDNLNVINNNDADFKYYLDRYKYYDRFPEHNQNYYRTKCDEFLLIIDSILKKQKYLNSDLIGFIDLSIFPFIRQFNHVDPLYLSNHYPLISNWLERIVDSKIFINVMKKYDFWSLNDEPLILNYNNY